MEKLKSISELKKNELSKISGGRGIFNVKTHDNGWVTQGTSTEPNWCNDKWDWEDNGSHWLSNGENDSTVSILIGY